jgi:Tfp pilus assembly protein PilF
VDVVAEGVLKQEAAAELASKAHGLMDQGNLHAAMKSLQQALALTPKNEDLHYLMGLACARSGDLTNAEHHYREALRLLPDYPDVHNNLGNLLRQAGRLEEAEKHFSEAIELMPENVQAWNNLGVLRQQQHRANEALICFEKAVECDTNFWEGHFNLALTLLRRGDRDRGIAELRETLRINPAEQRVQRALAKALGEAQRE